LCVVVVLVGVEVVFGVELVVGDGEELPPPHPATTRVLASTATSVSMAVSGVLLTGRAPVVVARGLGGSPYQGLAG
jgi:predicted anti-sigma-YlaC factor YlaD